MIHPSLNSALEILKKPFNKNVHLTLLNQGGSVEHYYHFLLGFFVPLILAREKTLSSGGGQKIYVRSCSILDVHIKALGLPEIDILDKNDHKKIKTIKWLKKVQGLKLNFVEVFGYDAPARYSYTDFCNAARLVTSYIGTEIVKIEKELAQSASGEGPKVIIINREAPHPIYLSNDCEKKGAGTSRRSIPNFGALHESIASQYFNTIATSLEGKSLAYQVALFRHADIIIAQHGAALTNLIFCTQDTTLIEIHPVDKQRILEKGFFKNLAACMKIQYHQVSQEHAHSEVKINLVLECMEM